MKKTLSAFFVVVGLLCMSDAVYAANDYGTNMARIILGAANYGTDPNGAYDITGANDNYITNDTSGVWTISATRTRITGNLNLTGEIAELDSILGALVMKSTVKVIGATTLSNVAADSITSACVAKSTFKVIGASTLSNAAIDSVTTSPVFKSNVKVLGKYYGANGDSILNDTANVWRIPGSRAYINGFRYPVIDYGINTTLAGLGKDTAIFARTYTGAPSVTITPHFTAGSDTIITVRLDSVTTTAAYMSYRVSSVNTADSGTTINATSNKIINWDWQAIGK